MSGKDMNLRIKANGALARFSNDALAARDYTLLKKLCGVKRDHVFGGIRGNFTDEHRRICKLLISEHGYTIYKMMMTRMEHNVCDN